MTAPRLHRRTVLRGAGGIAVGLPLLEAMLPRRARAADGQRRRFLTIVSPDGTIPDLWFPTGTETAFTPGAIQDPLARHQRDLVVFRGVDNKAAIASPGGGHSTGMACLLSPRVAIGQIEHCLAGGPTLDQAIAQRWAGDASTRTAFRSLELGSSSTGGTYGSVAYGGPGMPLPKTTVAKTLFDRVFAGATPAGDRLRQRRASILDRVMADYTRLQARLGADDRARLDQHVGAIREVEQRLSVTTTCAPPALTAGTDRDDMKKLPDMVQQMFAVLIPALACDATRVVTYMFRTEGANQSATFGWLGIGPPGDPYGTDARDDKNGTSHHTMSHYDTTMDNRTRLLAANRWFMQQIAALVDALKATPDGPGRTLFDGTAILYGSAIGRGTHTLRDIPFLLIGSAGKAFRTGRYLTYSGASHGDLLTSLWQAMTGDAGVFGDPAFAKGPLAGLA